MFRQTISDGCGNLEAIDSLKVHATRHCTAPHTGTIGLMTIGWMRFPPIALGGGTQGGLRDEISVTIVFDFGLLDFSQPPSGNHPKRCSAPVSSPASSPLPATPAPFALPSRPPASPRSRASTPPPAFPVPPPPPWSPRVSRAYQKTGGMRVFSCRSARETLFSCLWLARHDLRQFRLQVEVRIHRNLEKSLGNTVQLTLSQPLVPSVDTPPRPEAVSRVPSRISTSERSATLTTARRR